MSIVQERAQRLTVLARDLDTRAREARGDAQRFAAALEAHHSLTRAHVPDPGDLARLADMKRTADRLGAEAATMAPRAQAARQLAEACERFLSPHKVGGPDDSRFGVRGGRS